MASLRHDREYCHRCNLSFPDWQALVNHKMNSRNHISCDIDGEDFNTREGYKRHHDLMHAAEQWMPCPGCSKTFTRMGSLISHLELSNCTVMNASQMAQHRADKEHRRARLEAVGNPQPPTKPLLDPPRSWADTPSQASSENMVSRALNAPWGQEPHILDSDNYPLLPGTAFKLGGSIVPSIIDAPVKSEAWSKTPILLPDAPPKVTQTQLAIAAASTFTPPKVAPHAALVEKNKAVTTVRAGEEEWSLYDPDNPRFRRELYWNKFSCKYKCPHRGCTRSVEKPSSFDAHLKSAAHRDEKLKCRNCHRYFSTATGLSQHSEAQGVRCKVRDTDDYDEAVDEFTAGTTSTAGRHADNTVRYVVNSQLPSTAQIIQANREAISKDEDEFNSYWQTHRPEW
ncbi:hypothetical protein B7494_g6242 [Chlorociboria aeruginascens]|nr:hypothetical protein B7494_g6242 [Chlorociboria aeruginascens]